MPTPEKSITVNKIGGSNMSQMNEVLGLVKVLHDQNEAPILVVSAFEGVTNALIGAMDKQLDGTDYDENSIRQAFRPVLDIINGKIDEFIKEDRYKKQAHEHVEREMDICVAVLMTHKQVTKTLAPDNKTYPTRDKITAFGERSVVGILEAFLQENTVAARAIKDVEYRGNEGETSKGELHKGIQKGIAEAVESHREKIDQEILIIGGHVKNVLRGMVKEIGRSYTDTTAVDVTVALEKLLGIPVASTVAWKDVDGVLSGDPKQLDPKVNSPKVYSDISLNEGMELAGANSTLMQVDALSLAMEEGISLSLKNIKKPRDEGTTFNVEETTTDFPFKIVMANKMEDTISCKIPSMAVRPGFAARLTKAFDDNGVSINDIITSSTTIDFTVNLPPDEADKKELRKRIRKTIAEIRNIEVDGEVYRCDSKWQKQNKANVVIIGDELSNATGILSVITGVLSSQGINIDMLAQTGEQRKISFYVDHKDAYRAVQVLHRVFIDKDEEFGQGVVARIQENISRFLSK